MSGNNFKLITNEEIEYLNEKYSFDISGNKILVTPTGFNRVTAYDIDSAFRLNTKVRTVTISPEAIRYWIDKYQNKYSLFEVQNAISALLILCQDINEENIDNVLKRKSVSIKKI